MKIKFQGLRFMGGVAAIYALLYLYDAHKTEAALHKSAVVFLEILAIFSVVVFLSAAINYYVRPRELARHLGEESGLRGWLIALAAGVVSHGPMYAWYPMLKDLHAHGMRYGLMAAFFYARAIKVPLLPIMVSYFGLAFTVLLSFYILVAAWIQGWLVDRLCADCNEKN